MKMNHRRVNRLKDCELFALNAIVLTLFPSLGLFTLRTLNKSLPRRLIQKSTEVEGS